MAIENLKETTIVSAEQTSMLKAENVSINTAVFLPIDTDRIIEMAWEDRTPFDAIEFQFGLKEMDVKAFIKQNLKLSSYKLWRKRVNNCSTKHTIKRMDGMLRFKSKLQKNISLNKISKRLL